MSCFIVSPETVATIANYIADYITGGYNATGIFVSVPHDFIRTVTVNGKINAKQIFLRLYALNYMAYEERYQGEREENLLKCLENMQNFEANNKKIHSVPNGKIQPYHWQLLKSMECYLYQCSESEKLMHHPTFETVKAFETALTKLIICAMPEYEKAVWG